MYVCKYIALAGELMMLHIALPGERERWGESTSSVNRFLWSVCLCVFIVMNSGRRGDLCDPVQNGTSIKPSSSLLALANPVTQVTLETIQ